MFVLWTLLTVAALVALDQLTKWWAVIALGDGTVIPLWPEVFELRYAENRGMAFGLLQNQQWLFIVMTLLLIGAVAAVLYSGKIRRHFWTTTIAVLVMAGGIGNLIDRAANGFVIDFLYIRLINFPIFNVADICVTGAMVMTVVYLLFFESKQPIRKGKDKTDGTEEGAVDGGDDGRTGGQSAVGSPVGEPCDGAAMDDRGSHHSS